MNIRLLIAVTLAIALTAAAGWAQDVPATQSDAAAAPPATQPDRIMVMDELDRNEAIRRNVDIERKQLAEDFDHVMLWDEPAQLQPWVLPEPDGVQVAQAAGAGPNAAAANRPTTQPDAAAAPPATQPDSPPPPPEPDPVSAPVKLDTVRTLDKRYQTVRALEFKVTGDAKQPGLMAFRNGERRVEVPLADLVGFRVAGDESAGASRLDQMPDNAVAILTGDGEWIVGLISGGDDRKVTVMVVGLGRIDVPLKRIRGLVTPAGRTGQVLPELERYLLDEELDKDRTTDTIRLANGETINGTVIGIAPKAHGDQTKLTLTVSSPIGNVDVPSDVLNLARLINPLPADPIDPAPMVWVDLTSGTRLLAAEANWVGHSLRIVRYTGDKPLTIGDSHLAGIEVTAGRWRWLDNLTPALSAHQPFLTTRWPARVNTNVAGGRLRMNGQLFDHGLGVHSASRVVFDLDGAERFRCTAGLDASAGPFAEVDVQVLVDGRVEFEKKGVKLSDGPMPIDVRTTGGQKLELRVGFGANGDVQDRFNWADAALIMPDQQ